MAELSLIQTPSVADLLHERLDPAALLNGLVRSVAGLIGAALATPDGRSVAHSDHLQHDPSRAAMIAATMGLATQLIGVVGGRELEEVTVRCETGLVVVYAVGTVGVLTVLARPATNLHHVHTEVRARIGQLRGALGGNR
ncbi:MAG TPA: roadblock/LC7 domain-containing protein [Ilumatobacteraceae bacterium]|nr:roadblock/LC7 domain-containing protein [Ilumatobacteraceae bacterium]